MDQDLKSSYPAETQGLVQCFSVRDAGVAGAFAVEAENQFRRVVMMCVKPRPEGAGRREEHGDHRDIMQGSHPCLNTKAGGTSRPGAYARPNGSLVPRPDEPAEVCAKVPKVKFQHASVRAPAIGGSVFRVNSPTMTTEENSPDSWMPIALYPPEPCETFEIRLADGSVDQAFWTGRKWWRRGEDVRPMAWRMPERKSA